MPAEGPSGGGVETAASITVLFRVISFGWCPFLIAGHRCFSYLGSESQIIWFAR